MHHNPNRPHPHRVPKETTWPQHRARGGRPSVPYQRDTWAPPGWLLAALAVVAVVVAAVVGR